jgi:hypothetical protein
MQTQHKDQEPHEPEMEQTEEAEADCKEACLLVALVVSALLVWDIRSGSCPQVHCRGLAISGGHVGRTHGAQRGAAGGASRAGGVPWEARSP